MYSFFDIAFVVTCEHATCVIPEELQPLFADEADTVKSHRGWDAGALEAAEYFASHWNTKLYAACVSRLVCDANRSVTNRGIWSDTTRCLDRHTRHAILERWYWPHRKAVVTAVERQIESGRRVVHIAVHSFTPQLHGVVRNMDIGLLYAPSRHWEAALAREWSRSLKLHKPELRIRRNAPYRGVSDGLATTLRACFSPDAYIGFEVEFNQAMLAAGPFPARLLAESFDESLAVIDAH